MVSFKQTVFFAAGKSTGKKGSDIEVILKKNEPYKVTENFTSYLDAILDDTQKSYIRYRIMEQIDWYNNKACQSQKSFKRWMLTSIILSAIIPVLTLFAECIAVKALIAVLSSAVTAISAIISLYHWRELWVQYRTNCELLQSILHCYFTKTKEFRGLSDDNAFQLLVNKCEEYMTKEFQSWSEFAVVKQENQTSTGS